MPLKGKIPAKPTAPRLKCLISGKAGVGKTRAAMMFPKLYLLDIENGSDHYSDICAEKRIAVSKPETYSELLNEITALAYEPHEYSTLAIDSGTFIYKKMRREEARKHGDDFGRDKRNPDRQFSELFELLSRIDMNVVVTAHAAPLYGMVEITTGKKRGQKERQVVGETYDGFEKMDYFLDAWFRLERKDKSRERAVYVEKSRVGQYFPECSWISWTEKEISSRLGAVLTRGAEPVTGNATPAPRKLRDEYAKLAEQMKKAGKDPKRLPANATTAKAMEWIGHAKAWLDKKGEQNED